LTLFEQLQLPLHRSTIKKDAVEKMMDIIAGDIGFYVPLFAPLLHEHLAQKGHLTFDGIREIRSRFCPSASLQATLNACAAMTDTPLLHLEAGMGLKRNEERMATSAQTDLFPFPKPVPHLRVLSTASNKAARIVGIKVHRNMRVPRASIIARVFSDPEDFNCLTAPENLKWWTTSHGEHLTPMTVSVEAMKVRDRVWAIITPSAIAA
jgi:hypothetical protein